MTALVTGATGFLGSSVARQLLADGLAVRVLVRKGSDRRNIAGLDVEVVEGDLTDTTSLQRAVAGCQSLYHVAADYRLWVRDPAAMNAVNVAGTQALIRAAMAAGISRIVYTSSVAALGIHKDGTPANETTSSTLDDMIGVYKRSKFLAEDAVHALINAENAPVVIVNPSTPIGPRDIKPTPTGRIVVEAAAGRMPAYVDTGLNVVHVDDCARGHILAHNKGVVGERYILGGDDHTLGEILAMIARIAGRTPPKIQLPIAAVLPIAYAAEFVARLLPNWQPFATVDSVRMAKKKMYFSSHKAEINLGYRHRPAAEAIADAYTWFQDNKLFK